MQHITLKPQSFKRHFRLVVVALVALSLIGCGTPEGFFYGYANDARAAVGKAPLTSAGFPNAAYAQDLARLHSIAMCNAGGIFHSPGDLGDYYKPGGAWTGMAENVGVGPWTSDYTQQGARTLGLWNAFLNSPGHYDNITGNYTHQIVGEYACPADGRMYVTHLFVRY